MHPFQGLVKSFQREFEKVRFIWEIQYILLNNLILNLIQKKMQHGSSLQNFGIVQHFDVNMAKSYEIDNYFRTQIIRIENQMSEFSNIFYSHRFLLLNQLFFNIQQNSTSIQTLQKKLDKMDQAFFSIHSQLKTLERNAMDSKKDQKQSTEEDSGTVSTYKKNSKLHYKDLFREKMFGVKQYKYRLNVEGKTPQLLFKQRNISLKINLLDLNENKIQNQNAISLHLKVFYSNGEEIGDTKKGENFMKGPLNCTLIHGKAMFDKVYPREVSRKLDKRKIVLVIYASGMGNNLRQCSSQVSPLEVEPLIIYGVKVITKQNKEQRAIKEELQNEECESEFTP